MIMKSGCRSSFAVLSFFMKFYKIVLFYFFCQRKSGCDKTVDNGFVSVKQCEGSLITGIRLKQQIKFP